MSDGTRGRSGGGGARRVFVRGLALVGGVGEGGVRARLVQVHVGHLQADVVLPFQAREDFRHLRD